MRSISKVDRAAQEYAAANENILDYWGSSHRVQELGPQVSHVMSSISASSGIWILLVVGEATSDTFFKRRVRHEQEMTCITYGSKMAWSMMPLLRLAGYLIHTMLVLTNGRF